MIQLQIIFYFHRCNLISLGGTRITERTKFSIVEIQEMFENYSEKKELTLEVIHILIWTLLSFKNRYEKKKLSP